jgi:uncharacterized RDD family membrane protein YckC
VAQPRATDGTTPTPTPAWFVEPTFGQRLIAALADGLLLVLVTVVVGQLPIPEPAFRATMLSLNAMYVIGGVALTGRTLGKLALGLRVVDVRTGRLPGLGSAVVRWAVPTLPVLVPLFVPALRAIAPFVTLAIYLPILRPPLHRGLHDRAAGTVVTTRVG